MKYLIWIVLAVVIVLLIRMLTPVKRRRSDSAGGSGGGRNASDPADRRRDAADRPPGQELMMRCNLCGVHLPSSDAVFARGRVYCSAEHRDADQA